MRISDLSSDVCSSDLVREIICTPLAVPDKALNWISTDFSGRRDQLGYDRLQNAVNPRGQGEQALAGSSMARSRFRSTLILRDAPALPILPARLRIRCHPHFRRALPPPSHFPLTLTT